MPSRTLWSLDIDDIKQRGVCWIQGPHSHGDFYNLNSKTHIKIAPEAKLKLFFRWKLRDWKKKTKLSAIHQTVILNNQTTTINNQSIKEKVVSKTQSCQNDSLPFWTTKGWKKKYVTRRHSCKPLTTDKWKNGNRVVSISPVRRNFSHHSFFFYRSILQQTQERKP